VALLQYANEIGWQFSWWVILLEAAYLLALASIPSVLLQRRGRPQAALTWVVILFTVPLLGLLLWWAIGRRHLRRKKRKMRRAAETMAQRLSAAQEGLPDAPQTAWDLLPIKRLPATDAEWAQPPTRQNHLRTLINASEAYPAMEELIRSAQHHVHVLFYIWQPDETGRRFRDLLAERARAGVKVRVLFDAIGSFGLKRRFMDPVRNAGGSVASFLPPKILRLKLEWNFRNHRKLMIADSHVAILGGLNIGDEYHQWRDTAVRVVGPVVDQLQELFAEDWYFATKDDFTSPEFFGGWRQRTPAPSDGDEAAIGLIASGPHTEHNLTQVSLFIAINSAKERVYLTTPYFIPDEAILAALRAAAMRGLDVRVLVPERGDQRLVDLASRSYYPELLRAGVRIFLYEKSMLHAKTGVFDNAWSSVGSANVDMRSFRLNFELGCFVHSELVCQRFVERFEADLSQSRELSLEEVRKNSYFTRLSQAVAHLLSPLL